ncbi:alpha/beta hydrolase [Myceligenerans xiligouense]|uniref:Alpha/beta hydrolase family protein n=1 Tax=Myceligenerans xiligouense TaxID=253184 RepID=A0A3N4Z592_9MICO|nr:alpha/beta hydrolase [Myceligenerans xiligouense]RPF20392.1 alpha/beta hydrolase family protein [Myceligenerans xiligouense]
MTRDTTRPTWLAWTVMAVACAGVVVVAWACATAWGAVLHGHPAYAVLLGLTTIGCALALRRSLHPPETRARWRRVLDVAGVVAGIGWLAATAWLRPFTAVEPALAAMASDADVTVTETATHVDLVPAGEPSGTAVLFQPGAKVEARAYAAVLRPLAEAGHTVVIVKQPLGVGFLAAGATADAREAHPEADRWVLGGHSLGGVVAAAETNDDRGVVAAAETDDDVDPGGSRAGEPGPPVVGLLLYASYPAGDLSASLTAEVASISGSRDGLSTTADIDASRANLPVDSTFTVVEGAVHADFADYGPQPGDGTPTLPRDDARNQISEASVRFVDGLGD